MATEDAVDVRAADQRLAKMGINGTGHGGESRQEFENDRMGQTGADNAAKMRSSIPLQRVDIDIKTGVVTERHQDSPPSREDIADSMAVAAPLGSKPRAPRSDKGHPRPKPEAPAPAQSGPLTEQQWARVNVYFDRVSQSAADLARAERSHTALLAEAHSYLDSLKGGA